MEFTNLIFIFGFLPLSIATGKLCRTISQKNIAILIFSIIFYLWCGVYKLLLLIFLTAVIWVCSIGIEKYRESSVSKTLMILSVSICVIVLALFKYVPLIKNGILPNWVTNIFATMPLGLSFYIFSMISYVVDIYRYNEKPLERYSDVLLYTMLFIKVTNGPIARYADIHKTLYSERKYDVKNGIMRFSVGIAKKTLLANPCGELTASIFKGNLSNESAVLLWAAAIAFMLQIYLDFSGYSDMAIGIGKIMGIDIKENFDCPYDSTSVTEFWRRWHISLGTFFKQYVYIPLGGNRCGKSRQVFNLFVVWLLTGMWHGASLNFVLWGMYYFVLQLLEKFVIEKHLERHRIIAHFYLLAVVFFGWILFYFRNMSDIYIVIKGLFALNGNAVTNYISNTVLGNNVILLVVSAIVSSPLVRIAFNRIEQWVSKKGDMSKQIASVVQAISAPALLLLSSASIIGESFQPFIYAQF